MKQLMVSVKFTDCFKSQLGCKKWKVIFFTLFSHLVVSKVVHLLGLGVPGVPDHRVGQVVLLHSHLPARHHVGHDVLVWRVDVDPAVQSAVRKSKSKMMKGKKERNDIYDCEKQCVVDVTCRSTPAG